VKALR